MKALEDRLRSARTRLTNQEAAKQANVDLLNYAKKHDMKITQRQVEATMARQEPILEETRAEILELEKASGALPLAGAGKAPKGA